MEPKQPTTSTGLDPNIAALLCYAGWWVSGIVFLIIEENDRFIRFHAFQSIIVFGAATIALLVFGWMPVIGEWLRWVIALIAIAVWVALMAKAYQGAKYKLWGAGDLAERWAGSTPPSPPPPA